MVDVKDLGSSAERFARRAQNAQGDYSEGVENVSDSEQAQATLDAASNWETGVQEAISEGRFAEGVNNPTRSWQETTLEVGPQRFAQGVQRSQQTWQDAFSDFADVLEGLNLQPRGSRGSAANYERSRAVGEALHNARTQ